jgi:hypothetical protein
MAKRHQRLIEYELLLQEFMRLMTNQTYARGYKLSYSFTWEKGKGKVSDQIGGMTSNYYVVRLWCKDKREVPTGVMIQLYDGIYPITVKLNTAEKAEEQAYKDILLNGVQSLINVTFSLFQERQKQEIVKAEDQKIDTKIMELKQSAVEKPKLFVPGDSIMLDKPVQNIVRKPKLII